MKAKCVLFDLDGTLINSIPLIRESFRYATRKVLGRELPDKLLLANVGKPLEEQMEAIDREKAKDLVEAYREYNHLHHDEKVKCYPGIKRLLSELKKNGVKVGVVTSKSRYLALRGLEVCEIIEYVDSLVAADDVSIHKPSPEPIIKCLETLNCSKEEGVFVGDSPFDIRAGKDAGLYTIAVPFGPFTVEQLKAESPDRFCFSVSELGKALTSMHKQ